MLFFDGALGVLALGVWIFCIIDVITTPEDQVRNLPKLAWLLIVILLLDVGSIAWLVAGRSWNASPAVGAAGPRPGRAPARATNPDDDQEFLDSLRRRAEEQRRRARDASRDPGDEPSTGPIVP